MIVRKCSGPKTWIDSEYIWSETVKDWIAFPVAKEHIIANAANAMAIQPHFFPIPFSMVYIGPPAVNPCEFISRYLTERVHSAYFRVVPKNAVIHIQKSAPGPP